MTPDRELLVIADDDPDIVAFVEMNLVGEGYEVRTAYDGKRALELVHETNPDLVVLDVMMPEMNGFEVCRKLREDSRTRHIPIVILTARAVAADRIEGFTVGADDYIVKPFDPLELLVRVRTTLRRSREMRSTNPLTLMPGNLQIKEEVEMRIAGGEPFALLYIDLDDFKAFNDHYGFVRGDDGIKLLADTIRAAVQGTRSEGSFSGHIGGDDFVVVAAPEAAEVIAKETIAAWDASVGGLYDDADRERGYIEVPDRRGDIRRCPLTTVSIGVVSSVQRQITSFHQASDIAAEVKKLAKSQNGSVYAIDRRRDAPAAPVPPILNQ